MMADPSPPLPDMMTLQLTLIHANPPDKDLNCFFCHSIRPCEWEVLLRGFGRRVYIGLHEDCRVELEKKRITRITENEKCPF
jgi:hypothetical protein